MPASATHLLEHPALWRGDECARIGAAVPSGFAELDRCLPGGGWPQGALTELIWRTPGIGELSLLMPACAQLTQAGRSVIFVAPPYIPYAPALANAQIDLARMLLIDSKARKDKLWALEQALRSTSCGAALSWLEAVDERSLRRLQLACEASGACGFLFLPTSAAANPSTAALRIELTTCESGELAVHILKRRGGMLASAVLLAPRRH
jgi:cell division inhibitor SulA/protein ImuA